jgi:hypothetical protein
MRAQLIIRDRRMLADGAIIEIVVWLSPRPVPPSAHDRKYSLYSGRDGERLVCFDNERGKGDRKHVRDVDSHYDFVSLEKLLEDFDAEVAMMRGVVT